MFTKYSTYLLVSLGFGCQAIKQHPAVSSVTKLVSGEKPNDLSASSICKLQDLEWEIPGRVQNLQVQQSDDLPVLVYEAKFRSGAKTVWQPLKPNNLAFSGDGIMVGPKDQSIVVDFKFLAEDKKSFWGTYRVKPKASELYQGYIEYFDAMATLPNKAVTRIRLPEPPKSSVRNIWLLPSGTRKQASIVVHSIRYKNSDPGNEYNYLALYEYNSNIKKIAEKELKSEAPTHLNFVRNAETKEIFALGIFQPIAKILSQDDSSLISKIVARPVFSNSKYEIVLGEALAPISQTQLEKHPENKSEVVLSWIEEPGLTPKNTLKWIKINTSKLTQNFTKDYLTPSNFELDFEPNAFELVNQMQSGKKTLSAVWWGGTNTQADIQTLSLYPPAPIVEKNLGMDKNGKPKKISTLQSKYMALAYPNVKILNASILPIFAQSVSLLVSTKDQSQKIEADRVQICTENEKK
jgi:hypothetical protein